MSEAHFDVIIVGGRPAGAGLAARLGKAGLKVLVVDKATFPSRPSVPSNPVIYVAAMDMLDEIGIAEADYAKGGVKIDSLYFNAVGYFSASINMRDVLEAHHRSRNYAYSIERHVFDAVLWENLAQYPNVQTRQDFTVSELLRDEQGKVTGIKGRVGKEAYESFTADLVVGADGRFSFVAKEVGAQTLHEHTQYRSAVYFADWTGVKYLENKTDAVHLFTAMQGKTFFLFPLPNNITTVVMYIRPELVNAPTLQDFYLNELQNFPAIWQHLSNAEQSTQLLGMKPVGNGYRQTSGAGWVLVGDALHYKDPVDGQGIYDALIEGKLLAEAIVNWKKGASTWEEAVQRYDQLMMAETKPMFDETLARIKRELHDAPPPFIVKTLLRWMLTNPTYQDQFVLYLTRTISPEGWLSGGLMAKVVAQGIARDIGNFVRPSRKPKTVTS